MKEMQTLNETEEYLTAKLKGEEKSKFLDHVNAWSVETENPTSTVSLSASDSVQCLHRLLFRFDFIADVLNNKKHSGSNSNLYKSADA